jgi:hypothetical protein
VYVDENSHCRDEDERYTMHVYATYEEALTIARRMLEQDLQQSLENGKDRERVAGSLLHVR